MLFFSFLIPNINILLQVSGSINGTIITIIMPVVFYSRAYSDTDKNLLRDLGSPNEDTRAGVKILNIFVLIIGTLIGITGFVTVGMQIYDGKISKD